MRIIDVTYPFLVLFVIYLYQKVQHHDTVIAKIDKNLDVESHCQRETSDSEILNSESDHKKDEDPHQVIVKENLVHHVHNETKRDKSMNQNGSVSRKASNSKYNKHRHDLDASLISTYEYRKSFDAAKRMNKKKKAMKELWATQRNLFPNSSRKATDKKSVGDDGFKKSKQKQKQDFQERKKQQDRNVKNRKLMDNIHNETTNTATTTSCTLTTASFIGNGYSFVETLRNPDHKNTSSASFNLTVDVMTDDYGYDVAMGWTLFQKESHDLIIDSDDDYFTSKFYDNTTHVFDYYCVVSYGDGEMNVTINDDVLPTCFDFSVHNSQADEMLYDFGSAINVTMIINNKEKAILANPNENRTSVNTSFCFDSNDTVFNQEPFNTVFALDDDYTYDIDTEENNVDTGSSDVIPNDENDIYQTSCVLTKADFIPPCDDDYYDACIHYGNNGRCTDTAIVPFDNFDIGTTWQELMLQSCPKTCDACPRQSIFENQINLVEDGNTIRTFNLSLDFHADGFANETSWLLASLDSEDSIFDSRELNFTSQLENNTEYHFNYYCTILRNEERENQQTDDTKPTCYSFKVHDSYGDGLCCEFGGGLFSININTNSTSLKIEDEFKDGVFMNFSFCINHDDGKIESEGKFITTEQPTHYPIRRWQCRNGLCSCDSKPSLSVNTQENLAFMFEATILSDSDKLQDVESAQYRAACWILYDDPYEYDLADGETYKRMIQRYILAIFYFATSPEKWKEHCHFLSSRSECDWVYGWIGISCNEDENVIEIDLETNNLDGTIIEELSGLRMLDDLNLYGNKIHGSIPLTLGQLSQLRALNLGGNDLSGSIPDAIYSLKNLNWLVLNDNKLSSSISALIGNFNKLGWLELDNNMLTGQIPSTIGSLSSLKRLYLDNNRLSGSIPSTLGNMTSLEKLWLNNNTLSGSIPYSLYNLPYIDLILLQDNSVTGSVPNEFCDRQVRVVADCQNDMFMPEVSCSCCLCEDETPIRNVDCADATIKVETEHRDDTLQADPSMWSLTNNATGEVVLYNEQYYSIEEMLESKSYEACVAYSDCFSVNMITIPWENLNFQIYWNNNSIHNMTFLGYADNADADWDYVYSHLPKTMLTFQYNEENQQVTSCYDIKLECYEKEQPLLLEPNTPERITYDQATKISGRSTIHEPSSPQSKALCWMLQNYTYNNETQYVLGTEFKQRYILAILHFMSPSGLFGDNEYLAEKHECEWNGITCTNDNTKIVTGISLSSENNQIINGTLIDEIGNLKYLKMLELNQTHLHGTIPQSFSNLWSLTKLDISGNKISSTMPTTLFRQLNKLEYMDLSDNLLSGSINDDIGSYSHIRTLLLRNNLLTGSLPLESFKHYDLEHLDISENELSQIKFSMLLKHNNLKTLAISSNFLVGSLLDDTFTSLAKLEFFNVSQNDFSGTIPSTFSELSNMTHFDIHANRFKGTIPLSITELLELQHINLQGNQLTGSLPFELNKLKNLDTLVLSHNELKGSIPFDQSKLHRIDRLHLHSNKLEGEAPQFSNFTSYITDCGFPSDSLDPVRCSTCNTCCNSDGVCQSKTSEKLSQVDFTLIFVFSIIGFTSICYVMKDCITSISFLKSFFSETVSFWNAMLLISDKSVYHFLLAKNKTEWFVAVCCVVFQTATLFLFVQSADMTNEISDREYTMTCPSNSLKCDNSNTVSSYGKFIFGVILTVWLLKDIIGSIKLMLVSFQKRSIDFFFASAMVFTVTMLSIWTSIMYIDAIAGKNTDMIKDAVVLLFVVEIDERIFQLVESINPDWIQTINNNMRQSLVYRGDDLVISSWGKYCVELLKSMRDVIRGRYESFRKRNVNGSGKREMNKDKDEGGELPSDAAGVDSNP